MNSPRIGRARTGVAERVASLPSAVAADCRVLILGTAPSATSLLRREPYAHPQNLFWPLMGEFFDAGRERPYAERLAILHRHGIGLWDVYATCERRGSLDSAIVRGSEVVNDIAGLLESHPSIGLVALNGGTAQRVFRRRIAPTIDPERLSALDVLDLPSTSPAHAAMPAAEKRRRWQALPERLNRCGRGQG